ncbi:formylglycine-generating enzyme family protein [Pseudoduganella umbonata]|uniref:Formylglycine-generating enzyme family protein n=1 Tax=Pseudoduganella umbonata TaxID=864828 RepID=A0A4P8HW38_9BURK|nr:formylglycine-generating enzyme family protein [Pseudoduganella umbonata]MBB3221881.1 formylglycine-generating enzyme required for sulfatase activity [Pseudoduganella umbonata]QCP14317.1 formylglycine-generating enzyme family protein [Pseudoduganella umbonata]
MRFIAGGTTLMGAERFYPEEAPVRPVAVDGFWIDETPVTNAHFSAFVDATGYRTVAELPLDPAAYPGVELHLLKSGSLSFVLPGARDGGDRTRPTPGWQYVIGADWRHPAGPGSDIYGLDEHPVVHVAYADALAYAAWAGKELPTEAEWEFAARGGLEGKDYAWGDTLLPDGQYLANFWQGEFPFENLALDGYAGTSPVRSYPANGYGLFDIIGNVWEWTADWYADPSRSTASCPNCIPRNLRGASEQESLVPGGTGGRIGRKVIKGGSHLCSPSYCQRYRPAARQPQSIDTSTSHIGFRCVLRSMHPAS